MGRVEQRKEHSHLFDVNQKGGKLENLPTLGGPQCFKQSQIDQKR